MYKSSKQGNTHGHIMTGKPDDKKIGFWAVVAIGGGGMVGGGIFAVLGLAVQLARAIQQPALEIWQGKDANVQTAQEALFHRAKCNRAARLGEYSAVMEKL
jgi:hypothetical protein